MPHTTYDVLFNTAPVYNVRSMGYNDSASIILDRASGQANPAEIYLGNSEPIVTLQSTDLLSLLGLASGAFIYSGVCVTSASTTIPLAKRADCSVLTTGGTHTAFVGQSTITIPTQFEARQDSEEGATCSFETRFRSSDGITAPIAVGNTYSLTSTEHGTPYGLGKVWVNDVAVEPTFLTGIVVNPGIQLTIQRAGGGIFPVSHFIQYRAPSIDLIFENATLAATYINRFGTGNVAVRAFFRKRKDGSTWELDDATEHIQFAMASALCKLESLEAAQSGNGSLTIRCNGKALTATTGVAIE
jgi:hypothetical protein